MYHVISGVRPRQETAHNQFEAKLLNKDKLLVALVGLPARGKSYISHRLVNYLTWVGVKCKLFNVGAVRRVQCGVRQLFVRVSLRKDVFGSLASHSDRLTVLHGMV